MDCMMYFTDKISIKFYYYYFYYKYELEINEERYY